jgi:hypothetical protein
VLLLLMMMFVGFDGTAKSGSVQEIVEGDVCERFDAAWHGAPNM